MKNVETKELHDQMDSYFLAETLKYALFCLHVFGNSCSRAVCVSLSRYLFLLFDRGNFITRGNYVFNTEVRPSHSAWVLTLCRDTRIAWTLHFGSGRLVHIQIKRVVD